VVYLRHLWLLDRPLSRAMTTWLFVPQNFMPGTRPGMKCESDLAGRSPLRLATFSLPTHREVVAVVLSDYRSWASPRLSPGSRAFYTACLRSTPPRADSVPYRTINLMNRINIPATSARFII